MVQRHGLEGMHRRGLSAAYGEQEVEHSPTVGRRRRCLQMRVEDILLDTGSQAALGVCAAIPSITYVRQRRRLIVRS